MNPLADFSPDSVAQPTHVLGRHVPNKHPSITNQPYRIAICGEAPGKDEEYNGVPFVGASGRDLNQLLSKAHIIREACFIGNICQFRPPLQGSKQISPLMWAKMEKRGQFALEKGVEALSADLDQFNPNICLLLGGNALYIAKGVDKIGDWRGSFFIGTQPGPFFGRKCMASYHPAACLRQYEWRPLLMLDILKVKSEALTPTLDLPQRELIIDLSVDQILCEIQRIEDQRLPISVDIEGGLGSMSCVSIADSAGRSFVLPFANMDGSTYHSLEEDEYRLWTAFARLMASSVVPKIFQNGLYDRFVLQYGYDIVVLGNGDDTMLKFWEQYAELEKSLGFQCSILTKEPFYKFERKSDQRDTHYRYCCRDSAVTYEINSKLEGILTPPQKSHYKRNVELLNPLLYMELRGIRYDSKKAKERLKEVNQQVYELQAELDAIAGFGVESARPVSSSALADFGADDTVSNALRSELVGDRKLLTQLVKDTLCFKRNPSQPKKGNEAAYDWCLSALLQEEPLTKADIGRLNIELGLSLNIKSPALKKYLYETLKLPKQYKEERLTTDYEALLKIQKKTPHKAVELAIDIGLLRTRGQMLEIHADGDGRIRCGYNIVGTETGRLSCYTSPTGSGYNLQTIPSENSLKPVGHPLRSGMRDLFVADDDHYLFQCDLKGADGWTVGAYMAMLGDPTMLDDLKYGLKPANLVCLLLRHGNDFLFKRDRAEIKELCKEVKKEDFDYYLCKQGIWMTCYQGGPQRLANLCLVNSEGRINMTLSEVRDFQQAVFTRYRVRMWHDWMRRELKKNNMTLTAPNGFKRRFFGREEEVLGQALAHMPQVITTYATNTAMYRLWNDKDNRLIKSKSTDVCDVQGRTWSRTGKHWLDRTGTGATFLRIEPLHQVHDALIGQFAVADTSWAVDRIKSYFANPILIAGQEITIPFEGTYGLNWAFDDESKKGMI